jgi:hypothetical protein
MSLPKPTGSFRWTETPAGPALICDALTPYARHLFTARPWKLGSSISADTAAGWREVAAAMDVDAGDLVRVHQVHGRAVMVVHRRAKPTAAASTWPLPRRHPHRPIRRRARRSSRRLRADRSPIGRGGGRGVHAGGAARRQRADRGGRSADATARVGGSIAAVGPSTAPRATKSTPRCCRGSSRTDSRPSIGRWF